MSRVLVTELRTARKSYRCEAYAQWMNASMGAIDCTTEDQRLILEAAEADRGRILKGQVYLYVTGLHEGRFYVWRARPGMADLCRAHDLYRDD